MERSIASSPASKSPWPKGVPFIKTKLKNLLSDEVIERNFKLNQPVQDVSLTERKLEYLIS